MEGEILETVINENIQNMPQIRSWLISIMDFFNLGLVEGTILYTLLSFAIVLAFVAVVEVILRLVLLGTLPKLLQKIPSFKDQELKSLKYLVGKFIRILTVSVFMGLLTVIFTNPTSVGLKLFRMICGIYITVLIAQLISKILDMSRTTMLHSDKYRNNPLVNLFQVIKYLIWFIAVLYIISILFSINIGTITASLAALSAVLMLVFKDTILGFVASIQLSSNDMLRIGDWIAMPKYNVDGDVIDISLATIKVRNFDKTVSTVPPYSLITDSFQNYRPMRESGGRRVKRAIYIDMKTIKYVDDDLLERLKSVPVLSDYIMEATKEIERDNAEKGVTESFTRRRLTNIGVFRRYVTEYLRNNPFVHQEYTLLVRQRQPQDIGLPLELYFFTNTSVWADYEAIQSDVFDHLFAVIEYFDLAVFQTINGNDVNPRLELIQQTVAGQTKAHTPSHDSSSDDSSSDDHGYYEDVLPKTE